MQEVVQVLGSTTPTGSSGQPPTQTVAPTGNNPGVALANTTSEQRDASRAGQRSEAEGGQRSGQGSDARGARGEGQGNGGGEERKDEGDKPQQQGDGQPAPSSTLPPLRQLPTCS